MAQFIGPFQKEDVCPAGLGEGGSDTTPDRAAANNDDFGIGQRAHGYVLSLDNNTNSEAMPAFGNDQFRGKPRRRQGLLFLSRSTRALACADRRPRRSV